MKLAVLITCHNRREKTRKCLENLYAQELPPSSNLQVFVCDDGSSDGTAEMIHSNFPEVTVIKGTGDLYWNGGMKLAWEKAIETDVFDFYFWLNDDTFLLPNALLKIFNSYKELKEPGIITAACRIPGTNEFSYGGWNGFSSIEPNGEVQEVILISGNFVLIPNIIVNKIGPLSPKFTHYLGDFDYGLRAIEAGFKCYTSSEYLAECETNLLPYWGNQEYGFRTRWKMLHHVKGQAFLEYSYFKFRHYGILTGVKTVFDTYLKLLSPMHYVRARNFLRMKILKRSY
ncbi:glycosyltransferase family 2 protein [Algoriphagus yeomjeoni]|uniref:glycosyltransferase family 2 protein n=1 Tax=Algoriphagus yeomjeoni TaxID=291403 RepID=UPI003CE5AE35